MAIPKQLPLSLEEVAVHCFFHCPYVARADTQEAHDLMERHYTEKHTQQIDQIVVALRRSSVKPITPPEKEE